jgi:hypothetical protein
MAAQMRYESVPRAQRGFLASIDEMLKLSTLIEGLGEYGLAANGMTHALFAETRPLEREQPSGTQR